MGDGERIWNDLMKEKEIQSIFEELASAYENLKAEVLVSEVQENSKGEIDFLINNKSTFSRSYRRDVIDVEKFEEDTLLLNLSRNGIYDSLPEGFFHSDREINKQSSHTAKRKKYKDEEKDARAFFSPIENEFFHQRLKIEKNERNLLENFYSLNDDLLIDFWKINKNIPKAYILKLVKLLPHSYKVAGNLELTRLSMEKMLNVKVQFNKKMESKVLREKEERSRLGVDFVTQSKNSAVFQPFLEVLVGPIKEDDIEKYIRKDGISKFINVFYDYFIPLELDVVTKFLVDKKEGFVLNEKQSPTMGISTII